MSTLISCDGCGHIFGRPGLPAAIHGERADGSGGGGLPSGDFDWCYDCARVAFQAVKRERAGAKAPA
jgi:hypothetical protein